MSETDFGPNGFPAARIEALRIYEPAHDRFFDSLVEFLASFAGLYYGLEAQHAGSVRAFDTHQGAVMLGTHGSGVGFSFFPYFIFEPILRNSWPHEVRLAEFPLSKIPSGNGPTVGSVGRINAGLMEASFIRYYENQLILVKEKYGSDAKNWPGEWNFARVVRNAFAHAGKISFLNPLAAPVNWKNLRYGPTDNGKAISFVDITPVELILLMEDLDALL